MAKLVVELPEENTRFVIRYCNSEQIRKVLEQNAETIEEITPTQEAVRHDGQPLPEDARDLMEDPAPQDDQEPEKEGESVQASPPPRKKPVKKSRAKKSR